MRYVLFMFSRIAKQYQGMAFTPSPDRYSRRVAATYMGETVAAFLQGREKAYALHDALNEIQALFGAGSILAVKLVRQGMACEDEDTRAALLYRAVDLIEHQVRAEAALYGSS